MNKGEKGEEKNVCWRRVEQTGGRTPCQVLHEKTRCGVGWVALAGQSKRPSAGLSIRASTSDFKRKEGQPNDAWGNRKKVGRGEKKRFSDRDGRSPGWNCTVEHLSSLKRDEGGGCKAGMSGNQLEAIEERRHNIPTKYD